MSYRGNNKFAVSVRTIQQIYAFAFTIRIQIWFIVSLYHVLEISRHFIIVYLADLLIKRNKGVLFSLVGMGFSGTYQDWYLA